MPGSSVSLSTTVSCTSSGGTVVGTLAGTLTERYEAYLYNNAGYAVLGAPNAAETEFTFYGVPNGTYTLAVTVFGTSAGSAGDGTLVASRSVPVACAGPSPRIAIANIRPTAPTSASGTGSALFDVSGTNGRAFDVYVYRAQAAGQPGGLVFSQLGATNAVDFPVPGLPANTYSIVVYAVDPGQSSSESDTKPLVIAAFVPAPKGGCTDRSALNFDGTATFEDGTCQYVPPPVPTPVFAVPLLQTLRFAQLEVPDNCSTFEDLDNTLFCQQRRPGMQLRPLYYQPVSFCDVVNVQVLTNYDTADAVVHRHSDNQVLRTQTLTKTLALQGMAPFFAVELGSSGDGYTQVIGAAGALPASLLAAARLQLRLSVGGTELAYRVLRSGRASATVNDDYIVINRPWTGPVAGTPAVSWMLSGPGFNVWEGAVNLAGLSAGAYDVRVHGYDDANLSAEARSEPILYREHHDETVALDFRNTDNAYGAIFSTGTTFRLRVRGTYFRQKNTGTSIVHRNSDDSAVLLASTAQRRTALETYDLPDWQHERLFLITRLDTLLVNGKPGVAPEAYDWTPNRFYPLSSGRVAIEPAKWLGAGNSDDAGPNDTGENFLVLRRGGFLRLRRG